MNPTTAHSIDTSPDPAASPDLAKSSDRREHARSIKVMRIARLKNIQMHAECLGMVRDVSSYQPALRLTQIWDSQAVESLILC